MTLDKIIKILERVLNTHSHREAEVTKLFLSEVLTIHNFEIVEPGTVFKNIFKRKPDTLDKFLNMSRDFFMYAALDGISHDTLEDTIGNALNYLADIKPDSFIYNNKDGMPTKNSIKDKETLFLYILIFIFPLTIQFKQLVGTKNG